MSRPAPSRQPRSGVAISGVEVGLGPPRCGAQGGNHSITSGPRKLRFPLNQDTGIGQQLFRPSAVPLFTPLQQGTQLMDVVGFVGHVLRNNHLR